MTGSDRHPGDRLAALADGRLPDWERGRVLDHLTRCDGCRRDYEAQLVMKGLLGDLPEPGAPDALRARLSGLAHPDPLVAPDPSRSVTPHPGRPSRQSLRPGGPARPHRSARSRAIRAGAGLMSLTVLTLAGAYAVGGAPEGAPVTPAIDRYVREHAAVSGGLPLTEPVLWQLPASAPSVVKVPVTSTGVRQVSVRSGPLP